MPGPPRVMAHVRVVYYWGFTDVSDNHIFHDYINCLAHYGVTTGTGDGHEAGHPWSSR